MDHDPLFSPIEQRRIPMIDGSLPKVQLSYDDDPECEKSISRLRHSSEDEYEDALDDDHHPGRQESVTSDMTEGPDEVVDDDDDAFDNIEVDDDALNGNDSLPFMKETASWKNCAGICEQRLPPLDSPTSDGEQPVRTVAEQFCGVFSVDLGKMKCEYQIYLSIILFR
jgi:hypothetical protein